MFVCVYVCVCVFVIKPYLVKSPPTYFTVKALREGYAAMGSIISETKRSHRIYVSLEQLQRSTRLESKDTYDKQIYMQYKKYL